MAYSRMGSQPMRSRQGRIGIGVGAAGDRQKRGEFGVAQADEGTGDAADDNGQSFCGRRFHAVRSQPGFANVPQCLIGIEAGMATNYAGHQDLG
jgi:hypothetical protein